MPTAAKIAAVAPDIQDLGRAELAAWFNLRWLGRRHRFRHADAVMTALALELRREPPDHVIFSGDATALGFESECRRAAEALHVAKTPIPGLAIPGNHDYLTRTAARSGRFEHYFAPWQTGVRIGEHCYPFAQRAGPIWLVGVNAATGNRIPWNAAGAVGAEQRERLRQLLATLGPGPRFLSLVRALVSAIFNYGIKDSAFSLPGNPAALAPIRRL